MGSIDEIEDLTRTQQELKEFLGEMDGVLCDAGEAEVSEELINELNEMVEEETTIQLPDVPTHDINLELIPVDECKLPVLEE